jgi:hypothetical protein
MGDFFLSKLPAGHVILSMTRAAASTSLSQEPAFGATVAAGVDEARRQCAAMSWLLSIWEFAPENILGYVGI